MYIIRKKIERAGAVDRTSDFYFRRSVCLGANPGWGIHVFFAAKLYRRFWFMWERLSVAVKELSSF